VELLAPVARQALDEINSHLLLNTGKVVATGLKREADGSMSASWDLVWPEQQAAGVAPVNDARDQLPILRVIATSDLHNLVFQSDYRIIPAVTRPLMQESRS